MVDGSTAGKNYRGMVHYANFILPEVLCRDTFYLDKRTKINLQVVFGSQIVIG